MLTFCSTRMFSLNQPASRIETGEVGWEIFWVVGFGDLFEGEKGERAKINVSPNLSTQPMLDGFFILLPSMTITP
jgi:hypothetical protein